MLVLDQEVTAPLVEWRGPAPFYFLMLEEKVAKEILQVVKDLSYGSSACQRRLKVVLKVK